MFWIQITGCKVEVKNHSVFQSQNPVKNANQVIKILFEFYFNNSSVML
jgi:hypothetical protein